MSNKVTDPNHPHYFFQHTYEKWVRYNDVWFDPDEWEPYVKRWKIQPKVEWYYDINDALKIGQEAIYRDPSPDRLRRYFDFEKRVLNYYQHKAKLRYKGPHMG